MSTDTLILNTFPKYSRRLFKANVAEIVRVQRANPLYVIDGQNPPMVKDQCLSKVFPPHTKDRKYI